MPIVPTGKIFHQPGRLFIYDVRSLPSRHICEFRWHSQMPALSRRQLYTVQREHQLFLVRVGRVFLRGHDHLPILPGGQVQGVRGVLLLLEQHGRRLPGLLSRERVQHPGQAGPMRLVRAGLLCQQLRPASLLALRKRQHRSRGRASLLLLPAGIFRADWEQRLHAVPARHLPGHCVPGLDRQLQAMPDWQGLALHRRPDGVSLHRLFSWQVQAFRGMPALRDRQVLQHRRHDHLQCLPQRDHQ